MLDATWTRVPRPDVVQAFASDPQFRGLSLERAPAGFIGFAAQFPDAGPDAHLELDIGDADMPAHFPVSLSLAPFAIRWNA